MKSRLLLALGFLVLGACSTLESLKSNRTDYLSYLEAHVKSERLFSHGKQLLAAQLLDVTPELKQLQEETAPGYSVELRPDHFQVIIAVTAFGRRALSPLDLQFLRGSDKPLDVREVSPLTLVESLYPFAYPFYRVFLVDFEKPGSGSCTINILSPWGKVSSDVDCGGGASVVPAGGET